MSSPTITVLITTYNQPLYVGKAIESVLAQKVNEPFEIYISDDASTDNTPEILQHYAEANPCIRLKLRKENVGISRNWFEGLCEARGEFVCTLEGDDWWLDDHKLQKQLDLLREHEDWSAVSHRILQIDNDGNTFGAEPHDTRLLNHFATADLFLKGITFSCTACLCRNIFQNSSTDLEKYVTANRSIADYALCMVLLDAGRVFVMDETLTAYRVAGFNAAHTNYNAQVSAAKKYVDFIDVIKASERYWKGRYSFTGCVLANTFFPVCDAIKQHRAMKYLAVVLTSMPVACRFLFPFYFIGRCLSLACARIIRTVMGH